VQIAGPVLTALRDETGETALLGTLSGSMGVVFGPSGVFVSGEGGGGDWACVSFAYGGSCESDSGVSGQGNAEIVGRWHRIYGAYAEHDSGRGGVPRGAGADSRGRGWRMIVARQSVTYACAAAPMLITGGGQWRLLGSAGRQTRVTSERLGALGEVVKRQCVGRFEQTWVSRIRGGIDAWGVSRKGSGVSVAARLLRFNSAKIVTRATGRTCFGFALKKGTFPGVWLSGVAPNVLAIRLHTLRRNSDH